MPPTTRSLPLEGEHSIAVMRVVEIDPQTDSRWEAFVTAHPHRLIYHHPAWLQALEEESRHKPLCLVCEDVDGQIRGVLPLLKTHGLPFKWRNQMIGRRLSSLPRTPMAGPLALDREATAALIQAAIEQVKREPGVHLQLKVGCNELDGLVGGVVGVPWRKTYILKLPERLQDLRFGGSRNHTRLKWAVNKAARFGVQVREAKTECDLRAWYALYIDTMRWHAIPPRSYRFFQTCWALLQPRGLMRLLLAERHDHGKSELLAGSTFLMWGETIFYAFNGRRLEDLALRPNDAILWKATHEACRDGFRYIDLGEVEENHQGLSGFKSKWGTSPKQLYRYYYPAPRNLEPSIFEREWVYKLMKTAWRRLPLKATTLVGNWIYSYL